MLACVAVFAHLGCATGWAVECVAPRSPFNGIKDGYSARDDFLCPVVPNVVSSLSGVNFYTDQKATIIDKDAYRAAIARESEVRNFTSKLVGFGNLYRYSSNSSARKAIAECITRWLEEWAQREGLLGAANFQGELYRIWATVPIAMTYLMVFDDLKIDNAGVQDWISKLADRNWQFVDRHKIRNNIASWAAAGSAFSAAATGRCDLLTRSVDTLRLSVASVDESGVLLTEISRGRRALAYHAFALTPMALTAEVAFHAGINVYPDNNNALLRVARRIMLSKSDTSFFEQRSGVQQDISVPLAPGNFVWAEILNRHYDDPELRSIIQRYAPFRFDRAGGDLTMLFRVDR